MLPLRRRLALPTARRKLRQRRLDVPTVDLHVACSPRQGHTPSRTRTRPQSLRMAMRLHVLTELLGINVGGMPGAETPWAFWVVCALMIGVTGVEVWLFRRLKLI